MGMGLETILETEIEQEECSAKWNGTVSVPCTYFHIMLPLEHDIVYILNNLV